VKLDPSVQSWLEEGEWMAVKIADISQNVSRYRRTLEFDPAEVDRIEGRLDRLQSLQRKYGSMEKAISERDRIGGLLALHEESKERSEELKKKREESSRKLHDAAIALTKTRKKTAKDF